ncbi:MAG TPA: IS982 family transposase, partial [Candidatus Cloacimonetes bacterium]|nr:IS982 family transposase [Candidatus Cloacimonadota bacterium]
EIFCHVDDFNDVFIRELRTHQLSDGLRKRIKPSSMSESEVMTIVIYFHLMSYRIFKHYYLFHVCRNMTSEFPNLVSYNRFAELSNKFLLPLVAYLKTQCPGKCGISFIDSTPLRSCHIKREYSHKVLQGLTTKGQCSIGWFYGLKLHCVINDRGEIPDFVLTPGNVDDRKAMTGTNLLSRIYGKLFGDKGYIFQTIFEQLFIDGIHLIIKIRKNMKNSIMLTSDKIMLRKRALVETVSDELKNICQIEHTRHRSQGGFIVNLISGLIAHYYLPKKPSLSLEVVDPSIALAC